MSISPTPATRRWRYFLLLPFWLWILILSGIGIGLLQGTTLVDDPALTNLLTQSALMLAGGVLLIWFLCFSGIAWRWRLLGLAALFVLMGGFCGLFRFDGVSGDLIPHYSFRFGPRSGGAVFAAPTNQPVDLTTATPNDFPQFLGRGRDGSVDHVKLARDWSARPPRRVWKQPIGAGWAGFAVVNGQAVTLEQRDDQEMVTCYDVQTGRLQWAHSVPTRHESLPGGVGPRSTPAIDQGLVYTLGATGRLWCLDGSNGKVVWEKDLLKEYAVSPEDETKNVPWGRSSSPLIVGDLVIVPPGGPEGGRRVSLVAYHKKTGVRAWEGGERYFSYSSPALATLGDAQQVLSVNESTVSGHDPSTGEVLWEFDWPGHTNADPNVSQAITAGGDRLFLAKGYGGGAALMQMTQADGRWTAREVWRNKVVMRTKFTNAVIRDGHVYGLSEGILECIALETGKRAWKEGRYGHGQILRVGDLLLVLSENGEVVLIELTPARPNAVLGRLQAIEGKTWNNFALYGPYLLVRNAEEAACYELGLESR